MSKTLAGLLREFNIEVVDNSKNWCRGARQTCAGRTLARIFDLRGYAHLRMVIMSIVETKPNKRALIAPVIWAVSDLLMARPAWFSDTWLQIMDEIELAELFMLASATRRLGQPRTVVATMLHEKMRPHFDPATRMAA